jgi:hypothetical protein
MRHGHLLPLLAIVLAGCGQDGSSSAVRLHGKQHTAAARASEAQVVLKVAGMV